MKYVTEWQLAHTITQSNGDAFIRLITKIVEVNLFTFAYKLFHKDFSPIYGAQITVK